jgi:zinc transporter
MQAETPVVQVLPDQEAPRSMLIPGLVWAFRIHADGRPEALAVDQPIALSHDELLWLHFNLADARALQWLSPDHLQVPPQARALLLSKDTYQQLHTVDDCVYGVISDLLRDVGKATEDTGYLRFVMTEQTLVSGRHHALCAVDATRRALEGGQRIDSMAALLETIVEHVADTMDRIADRVAEALDEVEEQVLSDSATDPRQNLGRLRRTCVRLHRRRCGFAPASSPSALTGSTTPSSRCASVAGCCRKSSI